MYGLVTATNKCMEKESPKEIKKYLSNAAMFEGIEKLINI